MVNFEKQFDSILEKYQGIENNLNNQGNYNSEKLIKLNKEYSELKPIVETISNFKKYKTDIADLEQTVDAFRESISMLRAEDAI